MTQFGRVLDISYGIIREISPSFWGQMASGVTKKLQIISQQKGLGIASQVTP
jgi:hypothetical protein